MHKVSLVKCYHYDYDEVKAALIETLDNLGGVSRFVKKGTKVVLKPNLLMPLKPYKAATTHPVISDALADILTDAGAEVSVVESPGGPYIKTNLKRVYKTCGYEKIAEKKKLKLNYDFSVISKKLEKGTVLKNIEILKPLLDADIIINLPKLKSHGMMTYTGAVKNMFGAIPGIQKADYHFKLAKYDHFANGLIDIFLAVKPQLSIMDAIVGMEGEGPSAGTKRNLNFLAASEDAFALDLACINIINANPEEIPVMAKAKERKLLPESINDIEIIGCPISKLRVKGFKIPEQDKITSITFFKNQKLNKLLDLVKPKPVVNKSKCIGCKVCAKNCPAKVIHMKNNKPEIKLSECIRCFCCQELCPEHAIRIKKLPRFIKIILTCLFFAIGIILKKKK